MPVATRPSADLIRMCYPALSSETIFFENAGGSQVPLVVADAIRDYMLTSYVQVGAGYDVSKRATDTIAAARAFMRTYFNAPDCSRIVFGPSSSQLCRTLADAIGDALPQGSEIVVAETGHEANVGPWVRLQKRGFSIKWWKVDPSSFECPLQALDDLLTDNTKIVAFPHVSNLLGDLVDARAIADKAHRVGAKVVVDGVAFAPHRAIDMQAFDADFYFYSTYKVFGPHMAVLCGTADAFNGLHGPGHFFIPEDSPGKWELGCIDHEGCAGILALGMYLSYLAGEVDQSHAPSRRTIENAWSHMTELELPLQQRLVSYLLRKEGVGIVGPRTGGEERVGIVSFVCDGMPSSEIVKATDAAGIGIRNGHMYAHRLCTGLGIDPADGVVRVSFAHYNTLEEVERLIEVLERVLP